MHKPHHQVFNKISGSRMHKYENTSLFKNWFSSAAKFPSAPFSTCKSKNQSLFALEWSCTTFRCSVPQRRVPYSRNSALANASGCWAGGAADAGGGGGVAQTERRTLVEKVACEIRTLVFCFVFSKKKFSKKLEFLVVSSRSVILLGASSLWISEGENDAIIS